MSNEEDYQHSKSIIKLIFRGLIPLAFFIGGIVLLISRISGWNLILGLPITIIGLAILINTFDEVTTPMILPGPHVVSCAICKKPTPAIPGLAGKDIICAKCRQNLERSEKS